MILRVLNVNDTLDLQAGGGTAERTFQMSRFLARLGVSCRVLTIDSPLLDAQRIETLKPAKISVLPCLWQRFNVPLWNWGTISQAVEESDVIHLMGHWSVLNALVYLAAKRAGKPYVVCPAGALLLFGRSKWLKRLYNALIGNAIIRNAAGWIAVTQGEFPQFEEYGVPTQRVAVIPNGVDEEEYPVVDATEFKHRHGLPDAPMILFMGRLNPIKGPDLLLQAFLQARRHFPQYHLMLAGPDGGMLANLRATVERSDASGFVHFLGYVSGVDKSIVYRLAELLVVPSRQEAMSIVAIEAGFCGTPVLLTDRCGFGDVRSIDARLEVPATVAGIASGLIALLRDSKKSDEISLAWSNLVKGRYAWSSLVPEYLTLYQTITGIA
jgi:glycosyltransferase involved in cell wall biosynthesis